MNYDEYAEKMINIPPVLNLGIRKYGTWFYHPSQYATAVRIEDAVLNNSVIKLPEKVQDANGNDLTLRNFSRNIFRDKTNLTDIIFPSSIESIPKGAFSGCRNLRRVTIPKKIRVIEEGTFAGCESLTDIYYYLIGDEVCYFDKGIHGSDDGFYFDHDSRYSWDCLDLNISIPFKPGDVVTVDGRPFCEPKHVLLLEVGDDCCGVWAMYKKADGSWDTGAVKHGTVYDICRYSMLSPLYRMKKYDDVLTGDERILEEISRAIKKMELVSTQ